jgi:hypothetical protein
MTLTRRALAAATISALVVPALFATGSFAAAPNPSAAGKTYPTKVADVHVRSQPGNSHGSRVLATLPAAGTKATVTCAVHVTTAGVAHTWYRTVKPLGYIAGRNLVLPRHQATGLPACR